MDRVNVCSIHLRNISLLSKFIRATIPCNGISNVLNVNYNLKSLMAQIKVFMLQIVRYQTHVSYVTRSFEPTFLQIVLEAIITSISNSRMKRKDDFYFLHSFATSKLFIRLESYKTC